MSDEEPLQASDPEAVVELDQDAPVYENDGRSRSRSPHKHAKRNNNDSVKYAGISYDSGIS
jgi:hypothetical protein